jgi:hypothetical protein
LELIKDWAIGGKLQVIVTHECDEVEDCVAVNVLAGKFAAYFSKSYTATETYSATNFILIMGWVVPMQYTQFKYCRSV